MTRESQVNFVGRALHQLGSYIWRQLPTSYGIRLDVNQALAAVTFLDAAGDRVPLQAWPSAPSVSGISETRKTNQAIWTAFQQRVRRFIPHVATGTSTSITEVDDEESDSEGEGERESEFGDSSRGSSRDAETSSHWHLEASRGGVAQPLTKVVGKAPRLIFSHVEIPPFDHWRSGVSNTPFSASSSRTHPVPPSNDSQMGGDRTAPLSVSGNPHRIIIYPTVTC
ncbi:hypothetical protein NMY22_g6456 [Coprinellus aureogranulatus]|nr:hypothetical protein NMY22_g6456 [Coprinellus aureogranulatus]